MNIRLLVILLTLWALTEALFIIISRSLKRQKKGKLESKPRSGRPPVSTKREDNMLIGMVKKSPTKSLVQLESDWALGSKTTISKRLIAEGLRSHKMVEKPVLTKQSQKARLERYKDRESWTFEQWSNVAFSDESNFTIMNRTTSVFVVVTKAKNTKTGSL